MKALVGGGEATLVEAVSLLLYPATTHASRTATSQPAMPTSTTINVRVRDGFFLAEPEANVFVKLARNVRLTGGLGYRLVDGGRNFDHHDNDNRLRGVTGSIALQIGGGS
jgi:hypothetical protein